MAKACVLKSIVFVSLNEKKAYGIGLSSSVPKLWYREECTYFASLFSTQTDVHEKCSR